MVIINKCKILMIAASLVVGATLAGCGGSGSTTNQTTLRIPSAINVQASLSTSVVVSANQPVAGETTVYFSSESSSIATVSSASCNIPAGQTQCSINVNGISLGNTILQATAQGFSSMTSNVSVVAQPTLSIFPAAVTINSESSVTLSVVSSTNVDSDTLVRFASDSPSVANVASPSQCTIPAGQDICGITVTGSNSSATIQATAVIDVIAQGFATNSATITVNPSTSQTISFLQNYINVPVLNQQSLTAVLSSAASTNGVVVNFFESSGGIIVDLATPTCTVPQGQTQCSVLVTGESIGSALVYASANNYVSTTPATVSVPIRGTVSLLNPPQTIGSNSSTGTQVVATLSSVAKADTSVYFTSLNPTILQTREAFCLIPKGQQSCTNTILGESVGVTTLSVYSPNYDTSSVAGYSINVNNGQSVQILNTPESFSVGNVTSLAASLSRPAGVNGSVIFFVTNNASVLDFVNNQNSCNVPAGQSYCNVLVVANQVGYASIYAGSPGYDSSNSVLTNVSYSGSVQFISPSINMSIDATASTLAVKLSSISESPVTVTATSNNNTVAQFQTSTCTIPAGQDSCNLTAIGLESGNATFYVSASNYNVGTAPVVVSLTGTVSFIAPSQTIAMSGSPVTMGVQISKPAPVGGVSVNVETGDSTYLSMVNPTCTIPAGQTSCTVTVQGESIGTTNLYISAANYASAGSITATVIPIGTVSFTAPSQTVTANSGSSTVGVQISSPARAALTVSVSSGNNSILSMTTPSCNIPAGQTSCTVSVQGESVGTTSLYINAPNYVSAGSITATVVPIGTISFVSVAPLFALSGNPATVQVQLSSVATSPVSITVDTSDSSTLSVSAPTCIVATGANSCSVTVLAESTGNVTLYATAASYVSGSVTGTVVPNGTVSFVVSAPNIALTDTSYPLVVQISSPATKSVVVSVDTSSNSIISVDSPGSCTIPLGGTTCAISVTPQQVGNATLYATASTYVSGSSNVSVVNTGTVNILAPISMIWNQFTPVTIQLSTSAGPSGVVVDVVSSDSNLIAVSSPYYCTVPSGSTQCIVQITASGVYVGTATLTPIAYGYLSNPTNITVDQP